LTGKLFLLGEEGLTKKSLPPQEGKEMNGYHAPESSVGKDHLLGERVRVRGNN